MEDVKSVVLKDKREIHLIKDDVISISIISNGKTLSNFTISYPLNGYGGGTLYLSPSETFLLFSYYSGQSEEAFTIFKIREILESVYETGYF